MSFHRYSLQISRSQLRHQGVEYSEDLISLENLRKDKDTSADQYGQKDQKKIEPLLGTAEYASCNVEIGVPELSIHWAV